MSTSNPNPENGGFILNRTTPSQISCAQEATGFPATNLYSDNPNQIFKSNGSSTIGVKVAYSSIITLTGIAIINHSIPSSAGIKLHFYEGIWETWKESINIPWNPKNLYYTFTKTYQSIKLEVNNLTAAIYIGELYPGIAFQFPYNYEWGHEEIFNVVKEVVTTDEGVHFEVPTTQAPEFSRFSIKFSNSPAENLSLFYDIIRAGKKVFIPSFITSQCHFGIVPDTELKSNRGLNGDEYPIRFWEDAISGVWQI
jgi:hypothetical protein